ncbi:hypothetical protein ASL22_13180 [Alcaligenes faecalis]|nr:hypothetical protein ASL22_13180 [Alcaligenes faecalis]
MSTEIQNNAPVSAEPVAVVKDNNHCPEGTSDEISEYLPVGMKLYAAPVVAQAQPETTAEQFIQAAIDRAPEPLRRLGNWLTTVLDEDQWAQAERLLLRATQQQPVSGADELPVAVLRREIGESSWFDHSPVRPGSAEHLDLREKTEWDYCPVYVQPQPSGNTEELPLPVMRSAFWITEQHGHPDPKQQKFLMLLKFKTAEEMNAAHNEWMKFKYASAALAQQDADPLQGAADWLVRDCGVSDPAGLANRLGIGYNRASRLVDAARKEKGE